MAARTVEEIVAEMVDAKTADANLAGLTSTSSVAVWKLMFDIMGASIKFSEDQWTLLQEEIEDRAAQLPVGSPRWYAQESKKFQTGDVLTWSALSLTDDAGVTRDYWTLDYAVIDTTKQIIVYSAASVSSGNLNIKVAKDTAGVPTVLSGAEKTAVEEYWDKKAFAGTAKTIITLPADECKLVYRIYYNALVMDSNGLALDGSGTYPVHEAITDFLAGFSATNFGGDMRVMDLTSTIEAVTGVNNAVAESVYCREDGGSYTSDTLEVDNETYTPLAGHMIVDPLVPLTSSLIYIPS